jgi:hypothetical protein
MCDNPAKYRFTWPGNDEKVICDDCVGKLKGISEAMSFNLQIITLSEKDLELGLICNQKG